MILLAFAIIGLGKYGVVGAFIYNLERYLFGELFWLFIALVIILLIINIINHKHGTNESNPLPFIFIIIGVMLIQSYFAYPEKVGMDVFLDHAANTTTFFGADPNPDAGGGLFGSFFYSLVSMGVGRKGVVLIAVVLFIIAAILLVSLSVYKKAFRTVVNFFKAPPSDDDAEDDEIIEVIELEDDDITPSKDSPNLWTMLKKNNKNGNVLGTIDAEENIEDTSNVEIMDTSQQPQKQPEPDKSAPYGSYIINEHPEATQKEIPVVVMPSEHVESGASPFIDVDELDDPFADIDAMENNEEEYDEYDSYEDDYDNEVYFEGE